MKNLGEIMSTTIYIASTERAGKTALSAALGKDLNEKGKKVGFFVPVTLSDGQNLDGYRDAGFLKQVLGLEETVDIISPHHISSINLWRGMTETGSDLLQNITSTYNQIAQNKDIVIVEGLSGTGIEGVATLACVKTSEVLNAKVLIATKYSSTFDVSTLAGLKLELGDRLAGLIINLAPADKLEKIKKDLQMKSADAGIKVLGVIPEDRGLLSFTVADLAERLGGEIITGKENTGKIIENFMLGSFSLDPGTNYLNRKTNKAVIVRSERPDIQLAAMETSTVCLILTGSSVPFYQAINQARDKGIPVISVRKDTEAVVEAIEEELIKSSFDNIQKLVRFSSLIKLAIDFPSLYRSLGL
jgi:uncharacterized protein